MQNIKVFKLCFDRYLDKSVSFGAVSEDSASQWPIEYFQFSLIDPKSKLYCLCLCHECVRSRVTTNHRIVYRINHWALSCNHIWFSNCKLIAALRWVIVRTHRNRFSLSTASSYFHAAVSYSLCSIGLSSSTMEIHVWSNGMQFMWKNMRGVPIGEISGWIRDNQSQDQLCPPNHYHGSQRVTKPPLDIQIPAGVQIRLEQNTLKTIFAFIWISVIY